MGGFSELIKNFDKTRDYVREFFIYGFKVRGDFDRKSARTYDDEKRRVESWLGDYLRYATTERGKQAAITLNSARIAENPLCRALESRSFTDNDIRLHFLLLDLLADGQSHSIRSLTEALATAYGAVFEEQTVRGKLREYAAEGLLLPERDGKTIRYRLTPQTPERLFSAIPALADAVRFFACLPEFGFVGHTLLKAAGLSNDVFLMKHNYIVHILEDEILLHLTDAIAGARMVNLHYLNRRSQPMECTIVPLKIHASAQTGRRYLIGYLPESGRLLSFRLDYIRRVKDGGACENFAEYRAIYERNKERCFGVSFGSSRSDKKSVRITMRIDTAREPHILERLQREKRTGQVTHEGGMLYTYTVTAFDPNEMMQWVKTYIGRIVAITGAPEQESRFRRDVERMHRMYRSEEGDNGAVQ